MMKVLLGDTLFKYATLTVTEVVVPLFELDNVAQRLPTKNLNLILFTAFVTIRIRQ